MRIVRFRQRPDGEIRWGWLHEEGVGLLGGDPFGDPNPRPPSLSREAVRLVAPLRPSKIIGVGRNYRAHAAEHQADVPTAPLLFLKPPSSVIGPGEAILIPPQSEQVEHEAELAVVIGARGRWIAEERALEHVLGYTAANDVTARDLQRADPQWTRGKGFDTFCPLGPCIQTELELADAAISGRVNGEVRQRGVPDEMVFSVAQLVAYISTVMTLEVGDVILTGTPAGVGPLSAGDEVTVDIHGIGTLTNSVERDLRG